MARFVLTDFEWSMIQPLLRNRQRGFVARSKKLTAPITAWSIGAKSRFDSGARDRKIKPIKRDGLPSKFMIGNAGQQQLLNAPTPLVFRGPGARALG